MKKFNLIFLSTFFVFSFGFGQHFDVRAFGGTNVLQLTSDNGVSLIDGVVHNKKVSGRVGTQFGAALTFGTRFYVQPGFQYNVLSTQVVHENTETGNELVDETTIHAISVPLKVGFRLIDPETENLLNVRVFGGLDGSHITSVEHSKKSNAIDDIDASDFSNLILSADFGIGIDLFIFYADLGYQLGLSPVFTGGDNAKANAFYANLGIRLSF